MSLIPRSDGTVEVYDVEALKKCIEESGELTNEVKTRALMAIDKSSYSKGKYFPTFNILLVLDQGFALDEETEASILDVINGANNLIKTIQIKKC